MCSRNPDKLVQVFLLSTVLLVTLGSTVIGIWTLAAVIRDRVLLPTERVAAASALFVVALLGCLATVIGGLSTRVTKLLLLFIGMIIIVMCLQIGITVMYAITAYLPDEIPTTTRTLLKRYIKADVQKMDIIQSSLTCCGVDNYSDWRNSPWYNQSEHGLAPETCCKEDFEDCNYNRSNLFEGGCLQPVLDRIHTNSLAVILSNSLFVLLELIIVVVACQLYYSLWKHSKYDVL